MIKGYKGFKWKENKLNCEDVNYQVGKTYEVKGKIKLCNIGIHYCEKIDDVLTYYDVKDLVICEVEDLGKTIKSNDKNVTNKLKIVKIINKPQFDDKGNIIYQKDGGGKEYFWEYKYDNKGNIIYKKDCYGDEYFYKYDDKGNKIYQKDWYGYEYFWEYKYDDKGNIIYKKDCYGKEYFYKYDNKGNKTYYKDWYGDKYFYKYDNKGNIIYRKKKNETWEMVK